MKDHGSNEHWTAEKVKFAWNNGVLARFPKIVIRQLSCPEDTPLAVAENTDHRHPDLPDLAPQAAVEYTDHRHPSQLYLAPQAVVEYTDHRHPHLPNVANSPNNSIQFNLTLQIELN